MEENKMLIGIPKEQSFNETRVAATPETVKQLLELGFIVMIENGAGNLANFADEAYVQAGAKIVENNDIWNVNIILKVNAPEEKEIELINPGTILVSFLWPVQNQELMRKLAARRITVMAMDAIPRISRAQSIDALSSMANILGYRAVIEAAYEFSSFFNGQITAAGRVFPAEVMVIGAGVVGLAAIGMASSLGAVVRAFDIRPEVKEQVQSMGAKFLEFKFKEELNNKANYAKSVSKAFIKAEKDFFATQMKEVDIIITSVITPGKPAPKLITREMVASMKTGSVIIDLAAQNGGNCECTVNNNIFKTPNNVKVIGYNDLVCRMATQASKFYSNNVLNLMKLLCKEKDGNITINFDDVIVRNLTVIRNGEITWPAPPIPNSTYQPKAITKETTTSHKLKKHMPLWLKYILVSLIIISFSLLLNVTSREFIYQFTIFLLSCVVGYNVILNVSHSLHTPLMLVTNAISGIIIIGALLQFRYDDWIINLISFITVIIASINIFGGFAVTQRVLKMFRKSKR